MWSLWATNFFPCNGSLSESAHVLSVEQHSSSNSILSGWSLIAKCLMFKCLILSVPLAFPFFRCLCCLVPLIFLIHIQVTEHTVLTTSMASMWCLHTLIHFLLNLMCSIFVHLNLTPSNPFPMSLWVLCESSYQGALQMLHLWTISFTELLSCSVLELNSLFQTSVSSTSLSHFCCYLMPR